MILAGGASRRFGGVPKGLEHVGGIRIIDRVAAALRAVCGDLMISANEPEAEHWLPGVRVCADSHARLGGLGGILGAMRSVPRRDVVVVAWDMPFVSAALLELLVERLARERALAAVPEDDSPHGIEPFCAAYSTTIEPALAKFLDSGGGAAHGFIRAAHPVARVSAADVRSIGDPRRLFFSVNTPADLERARAWADRPA